MAAVIATDASSATAAGDGPVITMMNKRLRALRKKYNRILQIEEKVSQGKALNKEQEEVLRSKTAVSVLIEEYEHLRQPLSSALQEEIALVSPTESTTPPVEKEVEVEVEVKEKGDGGESHVSAVEDLLKLLYFGHLFDVKSQSEYETTMLMRTHERGCCITYDTVTDETTSLLDERDLDMISALGSLVLSRPPNSSISHKSALLGCLEHAKLWLHNSDQTIQPGSSYTYARLRDHLNKILASDYATATPEIMPSVDLAAEVGYTTSQVQNTEYTVVPAPSFQSEGPSEHYRHEIMPSVDLAAEVGYATSQVQNTEYTVVPTPSFQSEGPSEHYQHEVHGQESKEDASDQYDPSEGVSDMNYSDAPNSGDVTSAQHGLEKLHVDEEDQDQREEESIEPQFGSRRVYQNHRGNNRVRGGRGYPNGRGGRGGRGYQNGRGQFYDSGYYPRNHYGTRGRGGRGGGPFKNHEATAGYTAMGTNW